jgi:hypothetical protein
VLATRQDSALSFGPERLPRRASFLQQDRSLTSDPAAVPPAHVNRIKGLLAGQATLRARGGCAEMGARNSIYSWGVDDH